MHIVFQVIRFVTVDIIGEVLYWPLWWYTRGLWEVMKWAGRGMLDEWGDLALTLWLRAMFTPMYADYSFVGRAISFVFRILILGFRLIKFIIWCIWYMLGICIYAGAPAAAIYFLLIFFHGI